MEIADYTQGDEERILELFKKSFKKEMPLHYWKWRFLENPSKKIMIKLMKDGDLVVGHYAVSPVEMFVKGRQVLSALSMTTMTHPDYGGQGIFTTLAESLYKDVKDNYGVESVWGFPNHNSHYGFVKNLSWKDLDVVPTVSLSLDGFQGRRNDGIIKKEQFTKYNEDSFLSIFPKANKVLVKRTKEYLNWRYVENPVNDYKIFEYTENGIAYFAVTKAFTSYDETGRKEIDIQEISFPPDFNLLVNLITEIKEYYMKGSDQKFSKINLWLPIRDPKHILFEKMGFLNQQPLTYFGIRSLQKEGAEMEDISNWYYSMGDSDIY